MRQTTEEPRRSATPSAKTPDPFASTFGGYPSSVTSVRLQGWYYLAGGLWPLIHYSSFEAITGPKPDRFVTEAASIGSAILLNLGGQDEARRRLAVLTGLATVALDLRHRRSIRHVYLVDAAIEALLTTLTIREGRRVSTSR
jgi:hypothetical protein